MTHERNTKGIKAAAQRKRQEALNRADVAICKLVKEKKPINFKTVSETANVSKTWLYDEPDLRDRIEFLRAKGHSKRQSPKTRATRESLAALVKSLKLQNRTLRDEVNSLNRQLDIAYGDLVAAKEEVKRLESKLGDRKNRFSSSEGKSGLRVSASKNVASSLEKQIEDLFGSKLSPSILEMVQTSEPEQVENAIAAFKTQQTPIDNPGGWLREALRNEWKPSKPAKKSKANHGQNLHPDFTEWYPKATKDGFLVNEPLDKLTIMSREVHVKVHRPDPLIKSPYTLIYWRTAKLEWEAVQGLDS